MQSAKARISVHRLSNCPHPKECQEILMSFFPSCVHCSEMHVGNYKGCRVYKQIRKNRIGKPKPSEKPATFLIRALEKFDNLGKFICKC